MALFGDRMCIPDIPAGDSYPILCCLAQGRLRCLHLALLTQGLLRAFQVLGMLPTNGVAAGGSAALPAGLQERGGYGGGGR